MVRAAVGINNKKTVGRNAATVFDSSIAEHAQRAFGGTYNLFCFTETQFPIKQKKDCFLLKTVLF